MGACAYQHHPARATRRSISPVPKSGGHGMIEPNPEIPYVASRHFALVYASIELSAFEGFPPFSGSLGRTGRVSASGCAAQRGFRRSPLVPSMDENVILPHFWFEVRRSEVPKFNTNPLVTKIESNRLREVHCDRSISGFSLSCLYKIKQANGNGEH